MNQSAFGCVGGGSPPAALAAASAEGSVIKSRLPLGDAAGGETPDGCPSGGFPPSAGDASLGLGSDPLSAGGWRSAASVPAATVSPSTTCLMVAPCRAWPRGVESLAFLALLLSLRQSAFCLLRSTSAAWSVVRPAGAGPWGPVVPVVEWPVSLYCAGACGPVVPVVVRAAVLLWCLLRSSAKKVALVVLRFLNAPSAAARPLRKGEYLLTSSGGSALAPSSGGQPSETSGPDVTVSVGLEVARGAASEMSPSAPVSLWLEISPIESGFRWGVYL